MKKFVIFLLLFISILLTTGCPKNAPDLDLSDDSKKKILINLLKDKIYQKEWIEYKCSNDGFYHTGITGNAFIGFACGSDVKKNPQTAANIRNEVLDNGVGLVDSVYGVYIRDIRKKRSIGEFIADILAIGGSTAGGIVNGERPLQIIGVALTGFTAGRKSATLNFYDEKTTSILIKRMDTSRSQILGEIKQNQQKPTSEYSFDAALDDLVQYFDAGTLNRAFTELDKQTSVDAIVAKKGVLNIKGLQDITAIPSVIGANIITSGASELKVIEKELSDANKKTIATERLKSIYKLITEEPKFKDILKNLESKATNPQTEEDKETFGARLGPVYAKIKKNDPNNPLNGRDYYELVSGVYGATEGDPDLIKLLLDYFTKTK